jgi:hypothetical protein
MRPCIALGPEEEVRSTAKAPEWRGGMVVSENQKCCKVQKTRQDFARTGGCSTHGLETLKFRLGPDRMGDVSVHELALVGNLCDVERMRVGRSLEMHHVMLRTG